MPCDEDERPSTPSEVVLYGTETPRGSEKKDDVPREASWVHVAPKVTPFGEHGVVIATEIPKADLQGGATPAEEAARVERGYSRRRRGFLLSGDHAEG